MIISCRFTLKDLDRGVSAKCCGTHRRATDTEASFLPNGNWPCVGQKQKFVGLAPKSRRQNTSLSYFFQSGRAIYLQNIVIITGKPYPECNGALDLSFERLQPFSGQVWNEVFDGPSDLHGHPGFVVERKNHERFFPTRDSHGFTMVYPSCT